MEGLPSMHIKQTFGFCDIDWRIVNFSLFACPKEFVLHSPKFSVRFPEVTEWKLKLKSWNSDLMNSPEQVLSRSCISLSLERLESDTGPEIVWTDWKIDVLDHNGRTRLTFGCDCYFVKNQKQTLILGDFDELSEIIDESLEDDIVFSCSMIVDHNYKGEKLYNFADYDMGLYFLSEDLRRMCNRALFYDVQFRIGDSRFKAHLPLLTARNEEIGRLDLDDVIIISDQDSEALARVFRYFYTGNLNYIFLNPTVNLVHFLDHLKMNEILQCFHRYMYGFETKIRAHEFTLTWQIESFQLNRRMRICSERIKMKGVDAMWQVHLYPGGIEYDSSFIGVELEYLPYEKRTDEEGKDKERKVLDVSAEFFAKNSDGAIEKIDQQCKMLKVHETIESRNFILRRQRFRFILGDKLHLLIKIRVSLKHGLSQVLESAEITKPAYISVSCFSSAMCLNMRKLYTTGWLSDVVMCVGGKNFAAHKCILAARSKTFYKILNRTRRKFIYLDFDVHMFKTLLLYLYTGFLSPTYETEDLMRIYEAALIFDVPSLISHCSHFLREKLTTVTVDDILTFANNNRDEELRTAAIVFILSSQNETEGNIE